MAVYTLVSDENLEAFLAEYDVGEVVSAKGIAEGVENTNYLIHTERSHFILTLYEKRVAEKDLPYFLGLMEHLAGRGIRCPVPVHGRDGKALRRLAGRPAALVTFLDGVCLSRPQAHHCRALGETLARLHIAGADFAPRRENALGLAGWRPLFERSAARADELAGGLVHLITGELDYLEASWPDDLATGVVHADLFPDNVFFIHDAVSGLIDFYFACTDAYAYDLAVCLNAWCFERGGELNATKARALVEGYEMARPLDRADREALPMLCRGAALRFLLTRLYDWFHTDDRALVRRKDPLEYLARLRFHRGAGSPASYGL